MSRLLILNQEQQDTAIRNAQKLIKSWEDVQGVTSPATDNPSTTVHDLVKLLNAFKNQTVKG